MLKINIFFARKLTLFPRIFFFFSTFIYKEKIEEENVKI